MISVLVIVLAGWLAGVFINHAANVLPLKASLFQRPFCKRRLNFEGPEAISTAHRDDAQPARPAEYCRAARPPLAWSAVVAFVARRYRCRTCARSMGLRPLLVELVTPALFLLAYRQFGLSGYVALVWLYTVMLVLLTVTDLEHRLIQHKVILPAILLGLAGSPFSPLFTWQQAIFGGAVGFVIFYALALLARGGLGEGDVTLSAFLGLIVGFPGVILALLYGVLLGGAVSVILLITRRATMKTFIPYGPFLILAGWAVMVWNESLPAVIWQAGR